MSTANPPTSLISPFSAGGKGKSSPAFIGGQASYNDPSTSRPQWTPADIHAGHNKYMNSGAFRKEGR